jgi:D-alanyl-D-alanine carboxypeptidase/D-alanyl-D-alanine carboxypeptidase (penicillin-binding protein 5/6)
MVNHNKLLKNNIGVIAGKTGFTKKSGRCLVTCAQRDGLRLVSVTLNAPNDWQDHKNLFYFGFDNYKKIHFDAISLIIPLVSGQKSNVLASSSSISITIPKEYEDIDIIIEAPRFLFAGASKGDQIGLVIYKYRGKIIASSPILLCENADRIKYRFNLFEWFINLFTKIKEK